VDQLNETSQNYSADLQMPSDSDGSSLRQIETPSAGAEIDMEDREKELEQDDSEESVPRTKPWNPSEIRVTTKNWSLRQVIDDINDGSVDLAPDFQRHSVWKPAQRTLLIESILLGIPMPAFYFNADKEEVQHVVDGVQRLSTIRDFAKEPSKNDAGNVGFQLTDDLEYLKDLVGKRFHELDAPVRRRFHQTQIVVHVIDATSPLELKYDIFKRINTGGSPLTPQEIRHCMSKSRSREFLKRLVSSPAFKENVVIKAARMEDREMALRFIAFYRFSASDPSFISFPTSKDQRFEEFLLQAAHELDDPTVTNDAELEQLEAAFFRALHHNALVFGDHAYRKPMMQGDQRARMSRVLFEIWTVALARIENLDEVQAARVREKAITAMSEDTDFIESFTRGTGNPERIRMRFQKAFAVVKEALEEVTP